MKTNVWQEHMGNKYKKKKNMVGRRKIDTEKAPKEKRCHIDPKKLNTTEKPRDHVTIYIPSNQDSCALIFEFIYSPCLR